MMSQPENFPLAELSFFLFFLVPMSIIAMQYIRMGIKISKQTSRLGKGVKGSVHRGSNRKSQSHRAVVRMLAAVVIGFFFCWAPFHAQRLLVIYGRNFTYYQELNAWMFYITGIFYYFSSTLNPILYNVMSNRYRNAFKEILCGIKTNRNLLSQSSTFKETKRLSNSDHFKQGSNTGYLKDSNKHFVMNSTTEEVIIEEDILRLMENDDLTDTRVLNSLCLTSEGTNSKGNFYVSRKNNNETCI